MKKKHISDTGKSAKKAGLILWENAGLSRLRGTGLLFSLWLILPAAFLIIFPAHASMPEILAGPTADKLLLAETEKETEKDREDGKDSAEDLQSILQSGAAGLAASEIFLIPDEPETEDTGGIYMLSSHSTLTVEDTAEEYEWVKTNLAGSFMPYVISHAEGNPNVIHFLYEYGNGAVSPDSFTYTEEEKSADIPLLMQWDWRWGFAHYGGGPAGLTGCAPTCLAMIGFGLTGDESITPRSIAEHSIRSGFWVDGQGTSWALVTNAFPGQPISCSSLNVDQGSVNWALQAGYPVLINVRIGRFSAVGHFMVLAALTEDGTYVLNDPNNLENCSIAWTWSELQPEITAAWVYTCTGN